MQHANDNLVGTIFKDANCCSVLMSSVAKSNQVVVIIFFNTFIITMGIIFCTRTACSMSYSPLPVDPDELWFARLLLDARCYQGSTSACSVAAPVSVTGAAAELSLGLIASPRLVAALPGTVAALLLLAVLLMLLLLDVLLMLLLLAVLLMLLLLDVLLMLLLGVLLTLLRAVLYCRCCCLLYC